MMVHMPDPLFEEVNPDAAGRLPTTNGQGNLGFGYASTNRDNSGAARGYSIGGGLHSAPIGTGGGRADSLAAQAHIGGWRGENGDTNVGFNAEAAGAKFTIPTPSGPNLMGPAGKIDGEAFTANAGAYANSETASFGAGANIIAGSGTFGTQEENRRYGLSLGVGAAGRAHYGDADNDGVRELGFGFDAGPVSFDIKSESLGHAANWAGEQATNIGNGIGTAANWAGQQASNVGNGISNAWNSVTSW